jgi:hypothetical protein
VSGCRSRSVHFHLNPCVRCLQALRRADLIEASEGKVTRDWYAPIVADAEAGFGGPLNAYEMMKVRALAPLVPWRCCWCPCSVLCRQRQFPAAWQW